MDRETEAAPLDIKFQSRFLPNLVSNVIYFILNIIIGLALVPFFLDTLGEAAYGLVPLATSVTSYVTIIIDAVNAAVSRYLTVDLQQGNLSKAKETFNTAVFGTLIVLFALLPVAFVVAWFAPSFFSIGSESPFAVFMLFALVFGSAFVRTWGSNFQVTLFAYNRLDQRNWVTSVNLIGQVVSVVLLFILFGPSLPLVGLSYLIGAFLSLFLALFYSARTCPELTISMQHFNRKRMAEILGVSMWISGSQLAYLLRYNVALIVVNIVLGEIAGTEYSLVITWTTLLLSIASLITNTFTPMSYSYRARDDKDGLTEFTVFSMKIVGLVMALPLALVCIFSPQLFTVWVGEQYAVLSPLVWITVAPLILRIQTTCTDPIFAAYLRVRAPAIASLVIGVINIVLIFVMIPWFEDGLYGVAWASTVSLLLTQIFFQLYNAYVLKKSWATFIKPTVYGMCPVVVLVVIGIFITSMIDIDSILLVCFLSLIISLAYWLAVCHLVLSKKDRLLVRSCLPNRLSKFVPSWLL